jgi:hypothetical protein
MSSQIGRQSFDAWNSWYSIHKVQHNSVTMVKCNIDIAFFIGFGTTSLRLCFRDSNGKFMAGMTQW